MTTNFLINSAGLPCEIARRDGAPHEVRTEFDEGRDHAFVAVHFGLRYTRGNALPSFSVTCDGRIGGQRHSTFGGADHDLILQHLPELADLCALHLSDIDGAPLYAEQNGWYFLAGACGGFNEQYHAGNAESYGRARDPLGSFAKHCRITRKDAAAIVADVLACDVAERGSNVGKLARARWNEICASFRPRWKQEADAAIAKYSLTVFGDHWPVKVRRA